MLSMEAVLGVVNAKTRGGVSRTGEIEVQCPMGVCGHKKKPVYFSVNLERGQYNCFHCCSGCPYSGGIVDLFCLFNGLDPKKRQEANKALANALDGKPVESRVTLKYQPEPTVDVKSDEELDKVYEESYLNETPEDLDFGPFQVPEDHYFMMGDNRNNSYDSRYWDEHFVPANKVMSKVYLHFHLGLSDKDSQDDMAVQKGEN